MILSVSCSFLKMHKSHTLSLSHTHTHTHTHTGKECSTLPKISCRNLGRNVMPMCFIL